jgi:hypothetical protein
VLAEFSWSRIAELTRDFYGSLLDRPAQAALKTVR